MSGMASPADRPTRATAEVASASAAAALDPARTRAFGLPNLRRNVCPHFYVTGSRGALPIHAPHLLKGIVRQDSVVSRCQLRGGVHLEQSYVNDVCLSPRFNQCVFYEEELSAPLSPAGRRAAARRPTTPRVRALAERGRFGIRLGLGRTRALLHALGDPQLPLRGALVGGTNGKGSVLALAGSALRAAGVPGRVRHPSRTSCRTASGWRSTGDPIDPVTFARLVGEVLAVAERCRAAPRASRPSSSC